VQKKKTVKNPQEKAPKGNEKNPTQTGENDKVQQKITSFQTAKGGSALFQHTSFVISRHNVYIKV
jgi:hypothetical protein